MANSSKVFNDDRTVNDPDIEDRLLNIGRQVVKFAALQRRVRDTEFLNCGRDCRRGEMRFGITMPKELLVKRPRRASD